MSLEKIIEKILDDARGEAERIILETRNKAGAIIQGAEEDAARSAEAQLKESERAAQLEASRLITQARLEKKISILSRKKEIINEVLDKAFEKGWTGKERMKRKVILKTGEKEEAFGKDKLLDELRPQLEDFIARALKL